MADEHDMTMLPTLQPDLVAVRQPGSVWKVQQVSALLAGSLGRDAQDLAGSTLRSSFSMVTPRLWDLADEAVDRDETLQDIPVRFGDIESDMLVEVAPGGISDDYRNPLASFRFYRPVQGGLRDGAPAMRFGLVGRSPGMQDVFRKISRYAASEASVLITGETGTGKELVARALHDRSRRRSRPFVAINCSAISEELLESELFGHEKGAFTGAHKSHRGRFERADHGTIFLDEIGDMPLLTQAKLLRVLESGLIEKVGGEREVPVDVRIVCATNVPLENAVGQGRFRADLYHRIAVLRLHLPALRQRIDDLPLLIEYFMERFRQQYRRDIRRLTPEAMVLLQSYLWPGNIRELRNVLERVFVETDAEVIGARAFAEWIKERQDFNPGDWGVDHDVRPSGRAILSSYLPSAEPDMSSAEVVEAEIVQAASDRLRASTRPVELSVAQIEGALDACRGNLSAAARRLGVHRSTLYRYIEKHGLDRSTLGV